MKTPVRGSQPPAARKIGLDRPCNMCGSEIYFNYQGPLEGVCGTCTDKLRRRLAPRAQGSGQALQSTRINGFGWGTLLLAFTAGIVAGALIILSGLLPL